MNHSVFQEISPLTDKDCLLVFSRMKKSFTYPIHIHEVFELNYIENAKGALRVVGNHMQEIDEQELVLLTNTRLEHAWLDGKNMRVRKTDSIKEITIQFQPDLLSDSLLHKSQFTKIAQLFKHAEQGVSFHPSLIQKVLPRIEKIANKPEGLSSVLELIKILASLAEQESQYQLLSSSVESKAPGRDKRIDLFFGFLKENYKKDIQLTEVAEHIGMSTTAFSRYIKEMTGKTFIEILHEIGIAQAIHLLINTTETVSQICFSSGFNNISNVNRVFQKNKGCTPTQFRDNYWQNRVKL